MRITIRQASIRLGINPHFCKGAAQGLGIRLERVGQAWTITEREYQRLLRHLIAEGVIVAEAVPA